MTTKTAPASASVAGRTGPSKRAAAKACPTPVRTIAPATIRAVSAQPAQLARSRVPGQSFHQNATIAISASE